MPCSGITSSCGMDTLPDELILYIFKFLSLEEVLTCEIVCRRWRKLSRDPGIWRHILVVYSGKPGQTEVSKKNLDIIKSHNQYIYCIKIQYVYDYSFIISLLQSCINLISLELVMCRLQSDFVEYIKLWPKLRKFNVKNSLLLQSGSEMLINFEQFPDLTKLELADFGLSSVNCASLIQCPYLSHIFIEKIKSLTVDDIKGIILSKQKNLISFHIYGGDSIDDKCLHLLSQCHKLRDLAIIRCENLTDDGLLSLGSIKQINHLQLWNNIVFSELGLLRTLGSPNMYGLTSLSLSRISNISPVIVDVISEYYKKIKFLALYQCPMIINTDYEKQLKSKFRNIDVVLY